MQQVLDEDSVRVRVVDDERPEHAQVSGLRDELLLSRRGSPRSSAARGQEAVDGFALGPASGLAGSLACAAKGDRNAPVDGTGRGRQDLLLEVLQRVRLTGTFTVPSRPKSTSSISLPAVRAPGLRSVHSTEVATTVSGSRSSIRAVNCRRVRAWTRLSSR